MARFFQGVFYKFRKKSANFVHFSEEMKIRFLTFLLLAFLLPLEAASQRVSAALVDAVALYDKGEMARAQRILELLAQSDPDDDAVWYYLGKAEAAQGKTDDALKHITKASELDPKNYWYRSALAALYLKSGETDMVIRLYEDIMKEHPDKISVSYDLLSLYLKQGRFEDALKALSDVENYMGPTEQIAVTRYEILGQMGREKDAVASLQHFNEQYASPIILTTLGDYYSSEFEDSLALNAYREALALQSDYAPALVGESELYFRKRDYSSFFQVAGRFMQDPDTPTRSKSLYLAGIMRRTDPKFLARYRGDMDSLVQQAVSVHPTDSTLLSTAGTYYFSTERKAEAGTYFQRASELYPDSLPLAASYIQYLGAMEDWTGMRDKALEVFNKTRELAFLDYVNAADYRLKDYDAIIGNSLYLTKSTQDPDVLKGAWSSIGDMYHEKGDSQEAYRAYEKALKIDPDYAPVLNNYAYYLSLEKKKLKKAAEMSRKTIQAEPDNPTYLDTYAWILHLQKKDAEAKPYMKHAMIYGGRENAVLLDHYAEILYALKEYDLAFSYWMEAQHRNADGEIPDLEERIAARKAAINR